MYLGFLDMPLDLTEQTILRVSKTLNIDLIGTQELIQIGVFLTL